LKDKESRQGNFVPEIIPNSDRGTVLAFPNARTVPLFVLAEAFSGD